MLADIDQAQFSIVLETYKFRLDTIGHRVIKSITQALQRGVNVKVLMDGISSSEDADSIVKQLESDDCQVRIFHPLPWDFPSYRRALTANR